MESTAHSDAQGVRVDISVRESKKCRDPREKWGIELLPEPLGEGKVMGSNARSDGPEGIRLIPLTEVIRLTGRGRSRIYAEIKAGRFPQPVRDGASSRWVEAEILTWIAARIAERDAKAAA